MTTSMDAYDISHASDEPLYNIGVVARMTGIPVATLRVWERRYGFPDSARTAGGHRLYSEKEVIRLRWVKDRIDEGMQTGRAIRALQHLEQENRLTDAALSALSRPTQAAPTFPLPARRQAGKDTALAATQRRLTEALVAHNLPGAEQTLAEALALHPLENLILDVIQPTLADIGQLWADGAVSVATEHLSTNFLRHRLLMWMTTGPQPRRAAPVVLVCAPEEWHEGSLLMLGVLLRRQGWPVAYLGQSLPLSDLADFVQQIRPAVVVLLAMMEHSAANLIEWPRWLPEAHRNGHPIVSFGGNVFTYHAEWREKVPGLFLGETLEEGLTRLEQLLQDINTPRR